MDRELFLNGLAHLAFLLGMLLVLASAFTDNPFVRLALIFFGLVVGFMNIQVEEVVRFLLALLAVIATTSILKTAISTLQIPSAILSPLLGFLDGLIIFMSPAALVVGIGTLIDIIRD